MIHKFMGKISKLRGFIIEEVKDKIQNKKIVVATSSVAYAEISEQLKSIGMQENIDFCRLKDFMAEWYWKIESRYA